MIAQIESRVVDLTDAAGNVIHNMTVDDARTLVAGGDAKAIGGIEGHFALIGRDGIHVRMARTIGRLLRYFVAKRGDGPILIAGDRIDRIHEWLKSAGLADQFHPSYTRMVPAHYLVDVRLVGCPDPSPTYTRFFTPPTTSLPCDVDAIGVQYVGALRAEIERLIRRIPEGDPIGVCFSGGIDSGAVLLLAHHVLTETGRDPSRLKAFTLCVEGDGTDYEQAKAFLQSLDLSDLLVPIDVARRDIDVSKAIRVLEDYKPLDAQAGAVNLALLRGIRSRYPQQRFLLDGDGGDENLKDYPIEENPELTIRSVLNNSLLYQEGWGVHAIKHSLTYTGGQSRGYARSYAPAAANDFISCSPFVAPSVIAVAEAIPFIELTDWDAQLLYALKGRIMQSGIRSITGWEMPVFEKRRFQNGAMSHESFHERFPDSASEYRRIFDAMYE